MPQLNDEQWREVARSYQTEIRPDGRRVSMAILAKRYNVNPSSVVAALRRLGVEARESKGGRPRRKRPRNAGKSHVETRAKAQDEQRVRDAEVSEFRKREAVPSEIRQSAHVHACSEILAKHGRLYFREIERAFGCSSFDAATIAKAVRERTGATFDFEASPVPGGVRLFLVAKVAIPVVACVDGFLKCASGAHRSHPGKSCVEIDRTGQAATAEEMHP